MRACSQAQTAWLLLQPSICPIGSIIGPCPAARAPPLPQQQPRLDSDGDQVVQRSWARCWGGPYAAGASRLGPRAFGAWPERVLPCGVGPVSRGTGRPQRRRGHCPSAPRQQAAHSLARAVQQHAPVQSPLPLPAARQHPVAAFRLVYCCHFFLPPLAESENDGQNSVHCRRRAVSWASAAGTRQGCSPDYFPAIHKREQRAWQVPNSP